MLGALDFGLFQSRRDCADDVCSHLVLQIEDVVDIAVESLRPEIRARDGVDQLAGDPHAAGRLAQAAFKDVAHAKFPADLLHVDCPALVGEARVSRDDENAALARQGRDDVLHHAVHEVVLGRIAAEIEKGQNGNGRPLWKSQSRRGRMRSRFRRPLWL
jgi:hypothetical protein